MPPGPIRPMVSMSLAAAALAVAAVASVAAVVAAADWARNVRRSSDFMAQLRGWAQDKRLACPAGKRTPPASPIRGGITSVRSLLHVLATNQSSWRRDHVSYRDVNDSQAEYLLLQRFLVVPGALVV